MSCLKRYLELHSTPPVARAAGLSGVAQPCQVRDGLKRVVDLTREATKACDGFAGFSNKPVREECKRAAKRARWAVSGLDESLAPLCSRGGALRAPSARKRARKR